jgi:WD40 repeat protein
VLEGHLAATLKVRAAKENKRLSSSFVILSVLLLLLFFSYSLFLLQKVRWISSGTQLVSSGSDGLVRVWSSHDGSAVATLAEEQHSAGGKIWALDAARDGELLLSGGLSVFFP